MRAVPILAYPLNYKWDQPGNAARVVYHKIGLAGALSDSTYSIRKKIDAILENQDFYKSAKQMRERMFLEMHQQEHPILSSLYKVSN